MPSKINGNLSKQATVASNPPSPIDPISPIKIEAGCILKKKNPAHPPAKHAHKTANSVDPAISDNEVSLVTLKVLEKNAHMARDMNHGIMFAIAKPSTPSVKFAELLVPAMTKK
jgi:hypothetical protein